MSTSLAAAGQEVFIHPQALVESDSVGQGTRIWAFAHVMQGARIGAGCNIGDHAFIESGAIVGNGVTVKERRGHLGLRDDRRRRISGPPLRIDQRPESASEHPQVPHGVDSHADRRQCDRGSQRHHRMRRNRGPGRIHRRGHGGRSFHSRLCVDDGQSGAPDGMDVRMWREAAIAHCRPERDFCDLQDLQPRVHRRG